MYKFGTKYLSKMQFIKLRLEHENFPNESQGQGDTFKAYIWCMGTSKLKTPEQKLLFLMKKCSVATCSTDVAYSHPHTHPLLT